MSFLGIDLGTGGIRCLLVNDDGKILADLSRPVSGINLSDMPGHSEQNPAEWVSLLEDVLSELFSHSRHRTVRAIAVDSTSGTVLPVNHEGMPLGNALMHNDVRAEEEALQCEDVFWGSCSPTFSLPKALWMQSNLGLDHETLFLHATDFLNCWLVGHTNLPTDSTNAMKSGLDLDTGKWSTNLPEVRFPSVVSPGKIIGELEKSHRSRWGLGHSVKIVSGATDSNAGFYASGAGLPEEWSTTIGTTLAIKGISQTKIHDSQGRVYCHRHPDGHWLPGGASNGGGEILRMQLDSINALVSMKDCQTVPKSLVYPSIRKGERLPFLSSQFEPFFSGDKIFATCGAASSDLGLQIRANILQKKLLVPEHPHSAMGAAILAAAGFCDRKVGDVCKDFVSIKKSIDPCTGLDSCRLDKLNQFRELCSI
jgi:sugar (pentulose or hexulose) kinase